jgi:hypothetical protein
VSDPAGDVRCHRLAGERQQRLADRGAVRREPVADQRRSRDAPAAGQLLHVHDISAVQDTEVQGLAGNPVQFLQVGHGGLAERCLWRQRAQGEHAQPDPVPAGGLLDGADADQHRQ